MDANEIERIKQMLRDLKCPFCKDFKAKTYSGLIRHIQTRHQIDRCPVCGYSGDLDKHLSKCNDEAHQLFYAIYVPVSNQKKSNKLRKIRKRIFGEG